MWFFCTSGSPYADSTPHSASSVPRSTPKSCSIRANSASFFRSASLPAMMRQSETRRLMYCQICSLNSGWLRICLKTLMSGSVWPMQRTPGRLRDAAAPARGRESCRAIARSRGGAAGTDGRKRGRRSKALQRARRLSRIEHQDRHATSITAGSTPQQSLIALREPRLPWTALGLEPYSDKLSSRISVC